MFSVDSSQLPPHLLRYWNGASGSDPLLNHSNPLRLDLLMRPYDFKCVYDYKLLQWDCAPIETESVCFAQFMVKWSTEYNILKDGDYSQMGTCWTTFSRVLKAWTRRGLRDSMWIITIQNIQNANREQVFSYARPLLVPHHQCEHSAVVESRIPS